MNTHQDEYILCKCKCTLKNDENCKFCVMYILPIFKKKSNKNHMLQKKHFKWDRVQASVIPMSECFEAPQVLRPLK